MARLIVEPIGQNSLRGSVPLSGDVKLAERAILLAAISKGISRIRLRDPGSAVMSAVSAVRALGVDVQIEKGEIALTGRGLYGFAQPREPIDCADSETLLCLLTALLSAQSFPSTLTAGPVLSSSALSQWIEPLKSRGASIAGGVREDGTVGPLEIAGLAEGAYLRELEWESRAPSAEVKGAVLFSGVFAHGATRYGEPVLTCDHTERLLQALGIPVRVFGTMAEVDPSGWNGEIAAFEFGVPGDGTLATVLVAAAHLVPGSFVTVRETSLNPTRSAFVELVRAMGGAVETTWSSESLGEPIGEVRASFAGPLRGATLGGERLLRAIDEWPLLLAIAACAEGETLLSDIGVLDAGTSHRLATMRGALAALGVVTNESARGLILRGGAKIQGGVVDAKGDPGIALALAVLGLVADAPVTVFGAEVAAARFPRFFGTFRALGASMRLVD